MHNGDTGINVTQLQRQLRAAGFAINADGWFGAETQQAVIAFQRRAGLVADGIAGPKTLRALETRDRHPKHLSEQDLEKVADRLGITLAAIKAINTVETSGAGYLPDEIDALAARYPNLINTARGGYAGGSAEWSRLASACQVIDRSIAYAACSWGQYQIMGHHWQRLGYESIDAFVMALHTGEAAHLEAFARYIEADPALHKAIKAKKWPEVARLYHGPAYKANLYEIKLARAYERYTATEQPSP